MKKTNYKYLFILTDIAIIFISLSISFLLRFDFLLPNLYYELMISWVPIIIISQILMFSIKDLYKRLWRFTSLFDLFDIIKSSTLANLLSFFIVVSFHGIYGYPISILIIFYFINISLICLSRVSVRVYHSHFKNVKISKIPKGKKHLKRVVLVGAGKTAEKIVREILNDYNSKFKILGYVDDDLNKIGNRLHGLKIFGSIKDLIDLEVKFDQIIICIPTARSHQIRRIVEICKKTGKVYKTVPTLSEIINKDIISIESIRDVSYSDLLGRAEVKLDTVRINEMLKGKRILISGAGGSIGSELLKQCITFKPAEIVCVDFVEEKIFNIEQKYKNINFKIIIKPILVDINNLNELEKVFFETRPHIVIHAAAYKHVPIQELHPWTAVKTNIGGTLNIIELSDKYRIIKFVLVSTDKAVNPVNIMGATKRVSERLIQSKNLESKTQFMAVRFGNVLGSSGSALPMFQEQINKGGPVTITHPEMTRYFMSIPEASQLILQCGSYGEDGEIFILEMGKPIKIDNIARDLIKLSGHEPDIDISIVYTGLRPGEKLYEELQHTGEKLSNTTHKKIRVLKDEINFIEWKILKKDVVKLIRISKQLDSDSIQKNLKKLVSTYRPRPPINLSKISSKVSSKYHIEGEA